MDAELVPITADDKSVLRHLFELYAYDMSEYAQIDVDRHGLYGYRWLDHYFTDPTRHPFLLRVADRWAGFVLVNEHVVVPGPRHGVAEFFVLRRYRRHGVGMRAAHAVLDHFPGGWEVRVMAENTPGQTFWQRALTAYAGAPPERFDGHGDWRGPIFHCASRTAAP